MSLASLAAGFVDSIVGGGGLILIPVMFAAFPTAHPATLLGVNKGAAIWGTGLATWQYSRRVDLRWAALLPAALAGFLASFAGAWVVTVISPDYLRKALPFVLLAVLVYTLAKKDLGQTHQPRFSGRTEAWAATSGGAFRSSRGHMTWSSGGTAAGGGSAGGLGADAPGMVGAAFMWKGALSGAWTSGMYGCRTSAGDRRGCRAPVGPLCEHRRRHAGAER